MKPWVHHARLQVNICPATFTADESKDETPRGVPWSCHRRGITGDLGRADRAERRPLLYYNHESKGEK